MADQVATRLRRTGAKTSVISLCIGYSIGYIDYEGKTSFHQQMKIEFTKDLSPKIQESDCTKHWCKLFETCI